jgi:hypothetical protein
MKTVVYLNEAPPAIMTVAVLSMAFCRAFMMVVVRLFILLLARHAGGGAYR